jgi:glutamyl-Q tRNA(Asp) synthetase
MVAALASYLDARSRGDEWLVRMEDVDEPRTVPGADSEILRALEAHGLEWDGEVVYQSRRKEFYQAALEQLRKSGFAYPCSCSRREAGDVYPGTCRGGTAPGREARTWRVRIPDEPIAFADRLQGIEWFDLAKLSGDFVIKRGDGFFAYQLAVVVDDAEQGITDVVRGADLLDSTPRQLHLQKLLGYPSPEYLHIPVALNADGQKLSKQTLAPAVDPKLAEPTLRRVLRFLGQPSPPPELHVRDLLRWSAERWDISLIEARMGLPNEFAGV